MATILPFAPVAAATFAPGDVFVSLGNKVNRYDSAGNLQQTLLPSAGQGASGSAFDAAGNFYLTEFNGNSVSKYDTAGVLIGTYGSGYTNWPESILFSDAGDAFVGGPYGGAVLKVDPTGSTITPYPVAIQGSTWGPDWLSLHPDQCLLRYTSEGVPIKQYDVCTGTQLPDFANVSPSAFALGTRCNGEVLVGAYNEVRRLDTGGTTLQTYSVAGVGYWMFGLALDPDGLSVWAGARDPITNVKHVYKFDIETASLLLDIPITTTFPVTGLSVYPGLHCPPSGSASCRADAFLLQEVDLSGGLVGNTTIAKAESRATTTATPGSSFPPPAPPLAPPSSPGAHGDAREAGFTYARTVPPITVDASTMFSRCDAKSTLSPNGVTSQAYGRAGLADLMVTVGGVPIFQAEALDFEANAYGSPKGTQANEACDIAEADLLPPPQTIAFCQPPNTGPPPVVIAQTGTVVAVRVNEEAPPTLNTAGEWEYAGAVVHVSVLQPGVARADIYIGRVVVAVTGAPLPGAPLWIPNGPCLVPPPLCD